MCRTHCHHNTNEAHNFCILVRISADSVVSPTSQTIQKTNKKKKQKKKMRELQIRFKNKNKTVNHQSQRHKKEQNEHNERWESNDLVLQR